MKFILRIFSAIKAYFKSDVEKVEIQSKTCPHCSSRGMHIFKERTNDEIKHH